MASAARTSPRQIPLPLGDGPAWSANELATALARAAGRPVRLTLTENRSVLMSFRRERERVLLRLHAMFLHAPEGVVRALGRGLARRSRKADASVRRFMNDNLHRVRGNPRRLPTIVTAGKVYDLQPIFDKLNGRHFASRLKVPITWGRGSGRARRGGLTFASYDPVLRLIRIHPVLDRRDVPFFFLESVIHHEMLHHQLGGVADSAGRTVYHSRAFRQAEAAFPWHRQALAWEKENLSRLLRASQALDRARRARAALAKAGG